LLPLLPPVILSSQQKACAWAATAPRINDLCKLYWKFGGWYGSSQIRHIRNQSYEALANLPVIQNYVNKVGLDWDIGLGTAINRKVRFELEYSHHRSLDYSATPVLAGNAAGMASTLKSEALYINMFIDFRPVDYFMPYFGVLTGFVWNQTRTTASGGALGTGGGSETEDHYGYPWGLTVGARIPFMQRYFFYFGYRYVSQSKCVWRDSTTILKLQGQIVYQGVMFGVQGLIGN
jgi:opacity protein-like surface antigen